MSLACCPDAERRANVVEQIQSGGVMRPVSALDLPLFVSSCETASGPRVVTIYLAGASTN